MSVVWGSVSYIECDIASDLDNQGSCLTSRMYLLLEEDL